MTQDKFRILLIKICGLEIVDDYYAKVLIKEKIRKLNDRQLKLLMDKYLYEDCIIVDAKKLLKNIKQLKT